jgi:hypothetical protein
METEIEKSIFGISLLFLIGILLIETPAGLAFVGISLFFLYKKLSGG